MQGLLVKLSVSGTELLMMQLLLVFHSDLTKELPLAIIQRTDSVVCLASHVHSFQFMASHLFYTACVWDNLNVLVNDTEWTWRLQGHCVI